MGDSIPISLYVTGRAQCPDCGAPLTLQKNQALVECGYCGGAANVERRLRTTEASVEGMETVSGPAQWKPAAQIDGQQTFDAHCPTCGMLMQPNAHHSILRCDHCRTESKVEQRLVRRGAIGHLALEELARRWKNAGMDRFERETEALIEAIWTEKDLKKRVALTRKFESWTLINPATARLLPRLMAMMQREEPEMEIPLGDIISKLLCEGDKALRNAVVRAAEEFVFNFDGSQELLFSLGMGSGVCLKLLLDAANYAADAGAIDYACTALWGINWIFERNYPDRDVMGQIILYRLLYMRGPVQAWALELAKGQMGLGYRYPTPTLLRFMDDCVYERPDLLKQIEKCFYTGWSKDEAEYRGRIDFLDQELITKPARAAGLRQLGPPPENASDGFLAWALDRLLEFTHDGDLAEAACAAMKEIIELGRNVPAPVEAMIQKHGDALPEEVRRDYLRRVDKSPHLTPLPPKYWTPAKEPPKTPLEQQLDEWKDMWKQGLGRAVDARQARVDAYRAIREP